MEGYLEKAGLLKLTRDICIKKRGLSRETRDEWEPYMSHDPVTYCFHICGFCNTLAQVPQFFTQFISPQFNAEKEIHSIHSQKTATQKQTYT
jgi:hypothetical protein